ncbi:MAG: NADH-quinone oxidoreductase subunit I [Verrucomicrobiota bacterium]|nr:NADH-quinone oxidoreductase subunit I [Verrucomicrobiota bacterium]
MDFPGKGLISGLAVTGKNFLESFQGGDGLTTVQYPEEKIKVQEAYRNFPFLVYDESPDQLRCVACKICEKECPPQCIYIIEDKEVKGKAQRRPRVFDIDFTVCMGCQICVEVCPFEAIKMDQVYELSSFNRFEDQLKHKEDLLKSSEYYEEIHPTEGKAVNAKIRAQLEKKKKADEAKAAVIPSEPQAGS